MERIVSFILFESPLPEPGGKLIVDFSEHYPDAAFEFVHPHEYYAENILQSSRSRDLTILFELLDVSNVITLFNLVFTERPVLLVSSRIGALTSGEAFVVFVLNNLFFR